MKTYTSYQNDIPRIINNSLADNLTWGTEVLMDSIRYLVTNYYFNERSYTDLTEANTQFYPLPPQVKKLINVTISIGGVLWQPRECPSRELWDNLNVITFYQDFPSYFFVYNGQVGIWPIPASAGNTITMNYKIRIPDLSQADYTTGTVSATPSSTTVTGSSTAWTAWMQNGGWIRLAPSGSSGSANGDNQWYQISTVTGASTLTLKAPYQGATAVGATYTLGEVPILPEDYQDLPLYRLGVIYYTTRNPDAVKAAQYQKLWDDGMKALDDEFGSKTTSVILPDTDAQIINPNLFVKDLS